MFIYIYIYIYIIDFVMLDKYKKYENLVNKCIPFYLDKKTTYQTIFYRRLFLSIAFN